MELIAIVRRAVTDFCRRVLSDAEAVARLGLATHELLENSMRYSRDGMAELMVEVVLEGAGGRVSVRTRNRAAPEHLATLQTALDRIGRAPDPAAHYQRLIRETARRRGGSQLGLGRIRAEADMALEYEIEGTTVSVLAQACVGAAAGA